MSEGSEAAPVPAGVHKICATVWLDISAVNHCFYS